jgi:hypothetical protein
MVVVFMSVPCGLVDTSILEESEAAFFSEDGGSKLPVKCYQSTYLHGVTSQMTLTLIHCHVNLNSTTHFSNLKLRAAFFSSMLKLFLVRKEEI